VEGNVCELLVFLDALLTVELNAFVQKQKTFCLELGGGQTIATFPVHNFKSWVSRQSFSKLSTDCFAN